jgi:hypothetical protein
VAQKVVTRLVDDLDGESGDDIETVTFALDGVTYEIDLSAEHATCLRDELGEFVTSAYRVGGRIKRGRAQATPHPAGSVAARNALSGKRRPTGNDVAGTPSGAVETPPGAALPGRAEQSRAIREWARAQAYQVSEKGRIAGHIVEAFEAAHGRNGTEATVDGASSTETASAFSG